MLYKSLLLALLFWLPYYGSSQDIRPANQSKLHYRVIGFSFPRIDGIGEYEIQTAEGYCLNDSEFQKHFIKSFKGKTNRIVGEVPEFGKSYTWRYIYSSKNKVVSKSQLFYFSTLPLPTFLKTRPYRLTILKRAEKYKDAYVITDKNHVMYDMKGNPVWFLPSVAGKFDDATEVRNLRMSHRGTITFTTFDLAYEINYDGEILWETPNDGQVSGDKTESYHHQLTILSNNNYMILGREQVEWDLRKDEKGDTIVHILTDNDKANNNNGKPYSTTPFGTVIEYDTNSKVVWSWKSSDYFTQVYRKHPQTGKYLEENHENAFFFDEKNKFVYISLKNTSQILKIKYPDGIVTNTYGNDPNAQTVNEQNSLFCNQHSCKLSKKGYLYLFNNNFCNPGAPPSVLMMQEPQSGKGNLKTIWKYNYPYSAKFLAGVSETWTMGGNVIELPGSEIFVSMCLPYGNLFIVNLEKKLLWDALLESWNPVTKTWDRESSYRSSIIQSRKDMVHLIWSEETPNL